MKFKIEHEISKDELFDLLKEAEFSTPEKRQMLEILFPARGYTDKSRLVAEISEFIFTN